jgi:ArsR family transcriptional regulator
MTPDWRSHPLQVATLTKNYVQYIQFNEYIWNMIESGAFFVSLSDATRRRILGLLLSHGELCVCELVAALDLPQPKISRHLAIMRESGLTAVRREGTWIFYRLNPELPLWAYRILEIASRDALEAESGMDDKRLAGMPDRPVRCCA